MLSNEKDKVEPYVGKWVTMAHSWLGGEHRQVAFMTPLNLLSWIIYDGYLDLTEVSKHLDFPEYPIIDLSSVNSCRL